MKKCIISFANHKSRYVQNLARLSESLRNNFDGDFVGFIGEASLGCPAHSINPYAFKVYAFNKAREVGYTHILWLDSSCFAIKSVNQLFEEIDDIGFLFQDAGHFVGDWTNANALRYFGITKEDAMEMRMIGNAGMLGLNFTKTRPNEFFNKWESSMLDGCFVGSWDNHRHDMSCSSIIVNQMGIFHLAKAGTDVLQYAGIFDETANDTIIFKAQG